jgi:GDP-D-mannose dehydratase
LVGNPAKAKAVLGWEASVAGMEVARKLTRAFIA